MFCAENKMLLNRTRKKIETNFNLDRSSSKSFLVLAPQVLKILSWAMVGHSWSTQTSKGVM